MPKVVEWLFGFEKIHFSEVMFHCPLPGKPQCVWRMRGGKTAEDDRSKIKKKNWKGRKGKYRLYFGIIFLLGS